MYTVETKLSFEAAHRLYDVATFSEECKNNIHGHSYKVEVSVGREELNDASMVVDFKLLKMILRHDIEDKYDHSCIIKSNDPLAQVIHKNCEKVHIVDENPTAEWMAKKFFEDIQDALKDIDYDLILNYVAVQETENNIAKYSGGQ